MHAKEMMCFKGGRETSSLTKEGKALVYKRKKGPPLALLKNMLLLLEFIS